MGTVTALVSIRRLAKGLKTVLTPARGPNLLQCDVPTPPRRMVDCWDSRRRLEDAVRDLRNPGKGSVGWIMIKEMRLASVPATTRLNRTPVMFRSVVRPATFALAATIRIHVTHGMGVGTEQYATH